MFYNVKTNISNGEFDFTLIPATIADVFQDNRDLFADRPFYENGGPVKFLRCSLMPNG